MLQAMTTTTTTPVTAASAPGGRPRKRPPPDTPFSRWLSDCPLSVQQVADELGLTRWAVYSLRSGHHKPSLDVALAIAKLSDGAVPADSWPTTNRVKGRGKMARARRRAEAP